MPLEHDGRSSHDGRVHQFHQVSPVWPERGTGLQSHACHDSCLCCPAPSLCKGRTASVGQSGKAPLRSCCNVPADRKVRSCPCTPRASTARCNFIDHEPALGPLSRCSRCTVKSKRPYRVAGDRTATPDHPHIHRERKISFPGRRARHRSRNTWHS